MEKVIAERVNINIKVSLRKAEWTWGKVWNVWKILQYMEKDNFRFLRHWTTICHTLYNTFHLVFFKNKFYRVKKKENISDWKSTMAMSTKNSTQIKGKKEVVYSGVKINNHVLRTWIQVAPHTVFQHANNSTNLCGI